MDTTKGLLQTISIWSTIAGAMIPTSISLARWWQEKSRAAKHSKDLDRAIKLRTFLDADPDAGKDRAVTDFAQAELRKILAELSPPVRSASRLRQWFLLYKPPTAKAWLAHILFFFVIVFLLLFTISLFLANDNDHQIDRYAIVDGLEAASCFAAILHMWAAFESRRASGATISSKRFWRFKLYPANSTFGLLANTLLVLGIAHVIRLCFQEGPMTDVSFSHWYLFSYYAVSATYLPLGYCWSQLEYQVANAKNPRMRWRDLARQFHAPLYPEVQAALFFLLLASVWVLCGVAAAATVPFRSNPAPDIDGSIAARRAVAFVGAVGAIFFAHLLPALAVYRGTLRVSANNRHMAANSLPQQTSATLKYLGGNQNGRDSSS